ncbi:hypothetical protein CBS101457_005801 [Exobasidium rhododendri]|nr:hypothetical protein CBS101457_005801 [Exobasidium rhododendri]
MTPGAIKSEADRPQVHREANQEHQGIDSRKAFNAATVELNSKGLGNNDDGKKENNAGSKEGIGGGKTFARQHELPKLPIPKLEDSCAKYLTSLQPLQSEEDHEKTKGVVEAFLKNEGPKLQAELQSYASDKASYIEQWWDESYLSADDSVVLNLNPFFILEDDPTPSRGHQLMRTANLILASLAFVHDLRTGVLDVDTVRGTPLDMFQYTRLFGTARIPTPDGCRMESATSSKHVVVMRRGQMYWFDVLDDKHRILLTERALLGNLQAIVNDADKTDQSLVAETAIGILSTEKRKTWSHLRDVLKSNEYNGKCLEVIDSALFVVCMDDAEPEDAAQLANNMLCGTYQLHDGIQKGTCTNRWYDKLQIIVCANGAAGINFEHTGVDGHTVLRYVADVYTELIMRFAKSIHSATKSLFHATTSPYAKGAGKKADEKEDLEIAQSVARDTAPKKLEWSLNQELSDAIRFGETRLSDLICQNECQVLEFNDYGKNFITRHKFSPDAFVQMAFQAAYYRLYGRCETTYEPAMTKAFLHGRTEAIRTVQPSSLAFVQAYTSNDKKITDQEKIAKLRKACEGHTKLSRACAGGNGFDRHLYALNCITKQLMTQGKLEEGLPALFRDQGYATINHTVLSTSNCGNPALRLFGFGPVAADGFGLGYIIKDDALSICAASKHLQTSRFLDTLSKYLKDMQEMLIASYKSANARTQQTFIDHQGRECDIRTGIPIGSNQHISNGYDLGEDEGSNMYSFYGGGSNQTKEAGRKTDSRNSRIAGVGRMLLHNEYA